MKWTLRKFSDLTLLAFAITVLPAVSHANSVSSFSSTSIASGDFIGGAINGAIAIDGMVTVSITGSLATLTLRTGTLSEPIPGIFVFTGGTLTVKNAQGIFKDSLTSGNLLVSGTDSFTVGGFLQPTTTLTSGSTAFNFGIENGVLSRGSAGVNFVGQLSPIPEPTTFGLLGTGLIGVAGTARRKLKR